MYIYVCICMYMYAYIHYFVLCSPYFQEKQMGSVRAFTVRNYPPQPAVVYLFVKSVDLSLMLEFQSDVKFKISVLLRCLFHEQLEKEYGTFFASHEHK